MQNGHKTNVHFIRQGPVHNGSLVRNASRSLIRYASIHFNDFPYNNNPIVTVCRVLFKNQLKVMLRVLIKYAPFRWLPLSWISGVLVRWTYVRIGSNTMSVAVKDLQAGAV